MMKSIWVLMVLLMGVHAYADDIEVPEEELARETTLPVFSKRQIVLNRNVLTSQRLEVGGGAGVEMNEPYYNTLMYGFQGTYNFDETSAVNVQGMFWAPGLSSYGTQLQQNTKNGSTGHLPFDASKAPHPVGALMGNYEYIAYYGKISITKQAVMNLNTFGLAGLGYLNMGPVSTVAVNLGLGQNFFITNNFGFRWDLRWFIFQGPDATSVSPLTPSGPTPAASAFGNRLYYNAQAGLSAVFIL